MSSEASILIATGLISVVGHSISCYGRRRKNKLYKQRLSSLIMSKGTGKSTLKRSLSAMKSDLIIVDVNEVVKATDELEFLEKGKDYIDNLLKKFRDKKFLILCSNLNESKYFGCDDKFTFTCVPSLKLIEKIKGMTQSTTENNATNIHTDYLKLIRETDKDRLNIYSSFDNLYTVIKTEYKLQSNF